LRLLEEEAMKKGTEKVIAHLPIECATFLLNEKRSTIESIENRLKVDIVILPSKHLETPAYAIDRIREKEASADEKPSYVQIKVEDIAIPEFAQQLKPKSDKAVIKEFLHDSPVPAPVQNKNESASLIKRFWHKLVGTSPAKEQTKAKESPAQVTRGNASAEDSRQPRSRNNNRRGQGPNPNQNANREANPGREAPKGQQQARNPRPPRGQENRAVNLQETNRPSSRQQEPIRDFKRDVAPPVAEDMSNGPSVNPAEVVVPSFIPKQEPVSDSQAAVSAEESLPRNEEQKARADNKRNNARRGPNRRRPRNPNYKRPDAANENDNSTDGAVREFSGETQSNAATAYAADFANRQGKEDRQEFQASSSNTTSESAGATATAKPDSANES
jgi:ribonuclease E